MKIKDLIKYLETLDGEKELVILATDPTDWEYGHAVTDESIQLETICPSEDNGLEGDIELPKLEEGTEDEHDSDEVECYVIRMDV